MTADTPDLWLARGDTRARISLQGGELCAWSHVGRELLWSGDPAWWPRHSPVLFPVVGQLREGLARVQGRVYAMARHGFARDQNFSLEACSSSHAELALRSDTTTRAVYPFEFELKLTYEAQSDGVDIGSTVVNTGDVPMPFALGLHPGFRWPFEGASANLCRVLFEQAEEPSVPVITPQGHLCADRRQIPLEDSGRCLRLAPELFRDDALCFLQARSRRVRFESAVGSAIELSSENFPHWALWTRPGAPFLSIEAWTGHADPESFRGELAHKPSMTLLSPGASTTSRLHMRYRPGGAR